MGGSESPLRPTSHALEEWRRAVALDRGAASGICSPQVRAAPVSDALTLPVRPLRRDLSRYSVAVEIEREETLKRALRDGVNLFLGSGFSVLARDRRGAVLPTGGALADELRTQFDVDRAQALDLARLTTVISATRRAELRDFLTSRFSVASSDLRYEIIAQLPVHTVFTTNIDDLPFVIYQGNATQYINDLDLHGPMIRDQAAVDYVALHGSVRNPDRPYRFNATEVASSFAADPDRWRFLRQKLRTWPTVFWGYSLQDAGTLEVLSSEGDLAGHEQDMWILLSEMSDIAEQAYFRALGFSVLLGDTAAVLSYLSAFVTSEAVPPTAVATPARPTSRPTLGPLEQFRVPSASSIVLRPIEDFFKGSAPTWSDIYSPQLVRTSHYSRLADLALGANGVIATGIPASGKSTTLMQLVAHMPHDGVRLILEGPTVATAELVLRALGGQPAVIGVDNCTSDIDAFLAFAKARNVRLLGADRDYYLSIVLHRIDLSDADVRVHSVTPLADQDLQTVWESIPVSIRQQHMRRPSMTGRVAPSLFEFVQSNVRGPRLDRRLRDALRALRDSDSEKADLLLMVAYVHSCRTPVSLDMLIAYLAMPAIDYADVAGRLADIGEMLQEAPDDYLDSDQDYYTARSLIAGEAVIDAARGPELGGMLTRFHENLSPLRIVEYGTFKTRALGAHLFAKAFPRHQDGARIYDEQYARDGSPYVLQQKAQYLSHLGRHQDAFEAIELATARAHNNWTIRNAHAQILFRANIERADTPGAREQLDRAMATLSRCYASDRRKAVHALQFGDFALRYSVPFPDSRAREYLEQASAWLNEAHRVEPWLARVPRVRAEVRERLDSLGAPSVA